jgi:hypothetical protein
LPDEVAGKGHVLEARVRLILSRKGFDSSAGGVPSPIFEDGSMLSLSIPEKSSGLTYGDLSWHGRSVGDVVEQLTKGKIRSGHDVHHDPDLDLHARPRRPGWKPSLGQCAAAQSVLGNHGVGPGDIFLFFGWFRRVTERGGTLAYMRGARRLHVLFGWLQVGQALSIPDDTPPPWAADHPHVLNVDRPRNTIYVATDRLELEGVQIDRPSAGLFERYDDRLRLTAPDATKCSLWEVPSWLAPRPGRPTLGYHERADRWTRQGPRLLLQSVARGQEFVLDLDHYPEAGDWVRELVQPVATR